MPEHSEAKLATALAGIPEVNPVYVDGPLAGQECPVQMSSHDRVIYAQDPAKPLDAPPVVYTVRQFGFGGPRGTVAFWVASVETDPDPRDLAEHILSDQAKRAIIPEPVIHG